MELKPFPVEQEGWSSGESLALVCRDNQGHSTPDFLGNIGQVAFWCPCLLLRSTRSFFEHRWFLGHEDLSTLLPATA